MFLTHTVYERKLKGNWTEIEMVAHTYMNGPEMGKVFLTYPNGEVREGGDF